MKMITGLVYDYESRVAEVTIKDCESGQLVTVHETMSVQEFLRLTTFHGIKGGIEI